MIQDVLTPELEKKFGAGSFRTGESPLVVFPATDPDVGDVEIWDEGGEAIIVVGDIMDSHFYVWSRPRERAVIVRAAPPRLLWEAETTLSFHWPGDQERLKSKASLWASADSSPCSSP